LAAVVNALRSSSMPENLRFSSPTRWREPLLSARSSTLCTVLFTVWSTPTHTYSMYTHDCRPGYLCCQHITIWTYMHTVVLWCRWLGIRPIKSYSSNAQMFPERSMWSASKGWSNNMQIQHTSGLLFVTCIINHRRHVFYFYFYEILVHSCRFYASNS